MLIGLGEALSISFIVSLYLTLLTQGLQGGGAASSSAGSDATADLDFDSVQRGNPEMERRAQMVINTCVALGQDSPIAFIRKSIRSFDRYSVCGNKRN